MKTAKNTKSILSIFGLQFIDNKLMHKNKNGEYIEVEFNGKPMLLNYDYERANNKEPFILFNPKELLKNGTYLAFEKYGLEALSIKFNEVVSSLLKYTSNLNLQNEETAQLHPLIINLNKLHDFRIDIESFEDLLEKWTKINDIVQKQSFMNIYINFNCKNELIKVEENTLSNQPIVTVNFPLYDLLINTKQEQIFGININSTEIKALVTVYEFIFQNITKINGYQFPNKFTSIKEMDTKNSVPQLINTHVSAPFMFVKAFANIMAEINNIHDSLSSIEVFDLKNDPFNLIEIEDAIKEIEMSKLNFDSHKDGKDGLGNLKTTPYIDIRRLNNELNKKCQNHSDSKSTSKEEKYVKIRSLNPRLSYKVNQTSGFLSSRPSTVMLNNSKVSSNYGIQILDPTDNSIDEAIGFNKMLNHGYIIAGSGGGKSEQQKSLALNIMNKKEKYNIVVFEPHGLLSPELARLVKNKENLIYIDYSLEKERHPIINPLMTKDKSKDALSSMARELTSGFSLIIDDAWSINMEVCLEPIISTVLNIDEYDLTDVQRFTDLKNYDELVKAVEKNPIKEHRDYILNVYGKSDKKTRDAIAVRIQLLLNNQVFKNLTTGESTVDIESLLNLPDKVLIFKLTEFGSDDFAKLIMSMMKAIIMKRKGSNELKTYFFLDEFQEFVNPTIGKMLKELRKFGLHMIMAHQVMDDLDKNILKTIFVNTDIKFVGKLDSHEDQVLLAKQLQVDIKELKNLEVGEFYVKVGTKPSFKIKNTDKFLGKNGGIDDNEWKEYIEYQLENYYSKSKVATVNIKNEDTLDSDDFKSKLKNEFKLALKSTSKKLADF